MNETAKNVFFVLLYLYFYVLGNCVVQVWCDLERNGTTHTQSGKKGKPQAALYINMIYVFHVSWIYPHTS